MTLFKSALAGAAASALLVSQAAAAPSVSAVRTGTPTGQAEELGGLPSAAAPALTVLAIFVLVGLGILITGDDDDDDFPVSP